MASAANKGGTKITEASAPVSRTAFRTVLNTGKQARALPAVPVRDLEHDYIVAVTSEGHMLVTDISELPQMARGKGNKIINIPAARLKAGDEKVVALSLIQDGEKLTLWHGEGDFIHGDQLAKVLGELDEFNHGAKKAWWPGTMGAGFIGSSVHH